MEASLSKSCAILQVRLDPELKKAFDAYCAAGQRSQSFNVEALIRNLMIRWRERLEPDDWQRLMRNELSREQLQAIHRRAAASPPELILMENPNGNTA
jgi:hypothetical protein